MGEWKGCLVDEMSFQVVDSFVNAKQFNTEDTKKLGLVI